MTAQTVWNTLLERSQGDEDRFRRELLLFAAWASDPDSPAGADDAASACSRRVAERVRKGKAVMAKWGVG